MAILTVTSASFAFLAMHESRIGPDQAHLATVALKENDRGLFPHDGVYGPSGLWQLSSPIFQGLMRLSLVPSGYEDALLPFRLMTGPMALVYLCGMYALLYQQCRSWSLAVFVAIMSAAVQEGLEDMMWGFGSLETTTPETLCLAIVPLIVLAYIRYERRWHIVAVFAAIGILANLSLEVSLNLTLVFAGLYLVRQARRPKAWAPLLVSLAAAALMALPSASYALWLRAALGGGGGAYSLARETMAAVDLNLLYPSLLTKILDWRLLAMMLVLGLPSILVLARVERYRVRHEALWMWFLASALVVGFGAHGLSQALGKWLDVVPLLVFFNALKLALVPLFVLFSQALTNLFRLAPRHRPLLQWLCTALMLLWLGPADNLRPARHAIWRTATGFLAPRHQPQSVHRHRRRAEKQDEFDAIAAWVRNNTPAGATVLTDSPVFRMASRRGIVACRDDWVYVYYGAPGRLEGWMDLLKLQSPALYGPEPGEGGADAAAVAAQLAGQTAYQHVPEWYVLLEHDAPIEAPGIEEVQDDAWGAYFRLGRVHAEAATGPAESLMPTSQESR